MRARMGGGVVVDEMRLERGGFVSLSGVEHLYPASPYSGRVLPSSIQVEVVDINDVTVT
jgi:hypothetical protein